MEPRSRSAHLLGSLWVVQAGGLRLLGLWPISEAWIWAWAWVGELMGLPNSQVLRGLPRKLSGVRLVRLVWNGADFPWDSCQLGTSNSPLNFSWISNSRNSTPPSPKFSCNKPNESNFNCCDPCYSYGPSNLPGVRYLHAYPHFTVITKWPCNPGYFNYFWRKQLFLFVFITDMCVHVRCKWNNAVGFLPFQS